MTGRFRDGRRRTPRAVPVLVLGLLIASTVSLSAPERGAAGGRYRIRSRRIAPGLRLITMIDRKVTNRIRVLRVNPDTRLTLDVALANGSIPGHERTSSMARRHNAVAAINGDYTIRPGNRGAGRPVNIFAGDGRLETSSLIWGRNFAISRDESDVHIGHKWLSVRLIDHTSSNTWAVRSWNEFAPPPFGELGAYTADAGRDFRPPKRACSVRVYPSGRLRWRKERIGLIRDFEVDRVRCAYKRLARHGGTVIAAARKSRAGKSLSTALERGTEVSLRWSLGWAGVMDTIGGNPTLLERGRISMGACGDSYFCDRNPRTGIGVRRDGRILLVTVDGRQPGYSVGLRPRGFARLFKRLGATWALNVDGGGSTTMVVRDRVVNRPSDAGGERGVGSSVLILPGRDRGENEPEPFRAMGVSTAVNESSTADTSDPELTADDAAVSDSVDLATVDPASTGGMLDAVARGGIAPSRYVPGTLRPSLEAYRDAWRTGRIPPGLQLPGDSSPR